MPVYVPPPSEYARTKSLSTPNIPSAVSDWPTLDRTSALTAGNSVTWLPMTPMSTVESVGKNPANEPWKPCEAPEIITRRAKNASRASRTMAPRLGTHFI